MSNSRQQLLAYMQQGETTQGWGAISAFGRARLNRLLEQQFVASFDEFSFLPPFSMEKIYLTDDQTEWMQLQSVVLSKPLLSFETASLDNSRATLTLGIMAGTVTTYSKPAGKPTTLLSSYTLAEQQGYRLIMNINLSMVVGEVDHSGRVTLDLRNSLSFKCNLAEQLSAQHRIGEAFEGFVKALPRHKRVFELGTLDLKGYNALTPTTFYIRTQAAPGAKNAKSANYGEGGVLIFIALRGKPSPGYFPGEGSGFPYFIPDDQDGQGNDLYSAALVISRDMLGHVEQDRLDILNSLLFPGENVFVESSRHVPHDLIVFGNIDPALTSITIDPLFKVIHAGTQQQFSVRQASRSIDPASVSWSVRSINTLSAAGGIVNGLYTAVTPQQLGKQTVRNVVTAEYPDPHTGAQRRASALVSVAFEAISLAPQASIHYVSGVPRPIRLAAVSLSGGDLAWTLLEPHHGSLSGSGNHVTYTPPSGLPGDESLAVQRIEVRDTRTGQKAEATVLLLAYYQSLAIDPPHVTGLGHGAEVQLTAPDNIPPDALRWSIASGEGSVTQQGLFTAPAQLSAPTSVVRCEALYNGVVWMSGYSIIGLSDFVLAQSWIRLENFQLTAPNNHRAATNNGYQQIVVEIEIKPERVDGVDVGVTEEEISDLVISHSSGQALDYLSATREGIEGDMTDIWAVSTEGNQFNRLNQVAGAHESANYQRQGGIIRRRVYVHTKASDPETFHARFTAHGMEFNSNERSKDPPYVIELVPQTRPLFEPRDYGFGPKRVDGGGNNPPEQEDYDYHLTTTDYWYLEFTGKDGKTVRFLRCEFERNQSQIQWESRSTNETMFSYTGYIFNDYQDKQNPSVMRYDLRLDKLIPKSLDNSIISTETVGEGQLLLSLFRTDDVRYIASEVATELEQPLIVNLLDQNGNSHRLNIGFAAMDVADSRNTLILRVI